MDPIEAFVKANRKFSFPLLINTHARLCVLQISKGSILYDDIMQSLALSARDMTAQEINAHAALVYEAVLTPMINSKNQMVLQLKQDVIANDPNFVKSVLYVLYARAGGMDNPAVEEFKAEANLFLKSSAPPANIPAYPLAPKLTSTGEGQQPPADSYGRDDAQPSSTNNGRHSTQSYNERFSNQAGEYSPFPATAHASTNGASPNSREAVGEDVTFPSSRIEFGKSEPIIRLLAQVRKVGMDILFPQSVHDKVLAAIFVAIKSSATAAHRELIDMVMSLKESNSITQLETVSKTKVRGVLALLKHGEMLITQGSDGEPVRLFLANGIDTFKDLRDRHDVFIMRYMTEHHLFIPAILKCELVWQFDEDTTRLRIEAMNKLMSKLEHYYCSYQEVAPSLPPQQQQPQKQSSYAAPPRAPMNGGREDSYGFVVDDTRSRSSVLTEMTSSDSMSMRSFNDDYRHGASNHAGYDHHRGPPAGGSDYQPQQQFQMKYEQDWAAQGRRPSGQQPRNPTYGVSPYGQRYQNGGGRYSGSGNSAGSGQGHYPEHSYSSYPAHLGSHSGSHSHSHHSNHSNYSNGSSYGSTSKSSSYHQLSQYPPLPIPPPQQQGDGGFPGDRDRYSGGGGDRYGGAPPRSSRHQPPTRANALSASAAAFRPDYRHENSARGTGGNDGMFMNERERSMQRETEYYPRDDGYGSMNNTHGHGAGAPPPSRSDLAAYNSRSHSSQGRSGESFHRDSSMDSLQRETLSGSFYEGMAGLGGGGRGLSASGFGDDWQGLGPGDTLGGRMLSAISKKSSPRHPSSLAFDMSTSNDFFSMHQLGKATAAVASGSLDLDTDASAFAKMMPAGLLGSLEPDDIQLKIKPEVESSDKLSSSVAPVNESFGPSANIDSIIG